MKERDIKFVFEEISLYEDNHVVSFCGYFCLWMWGGLSILLL
jgi:hypothetical protein